jgi:hypothetical protein
VEEQATIIENLKDQLAKAKAQLASLQKKSGKSTGESGFSSLFQLLSSVEIIIPDNIREDGSEKSNLVNLFWGNQAHFVAGVTNSPFNEAAENFLYYNLATKLKVHGLMREKRLVGKKIDCLATSPRGDQFLAWLDQQKSEGKITQVPKS